MERLGYANACDDLSFGAIKFRAVMEFERQREETLAVSVAVRAGGADEDGWKKWFRRMNPD